MNPKRTQKRGKRLCACCGNKENFDSNEVIFEYFGKEFTEYEYVIENLAIRPAPKKLLDLVPVHSTNISKKSIYKMPTMNNYAKEALHKPTSSFRASGPTVMPNDHGDGRKAEKPASKFLDPTKRTDDFISLKILPDEAEPRICGPCNPMAANYNPCSKKYPYDQKPCGSCMVETFPEKCKLTDSETVSNVLKLRRNIKGREYRTAKQILSDLCEASEQSLYIKSKSCKVTDRSMTMPVEIQNTIETLRFKKPLPQFFTRTENRPFHKPGVYFVDVAQDNTLAGTDNTITETTEEQRINGQAEAEKLSVLLGQQRLSSVYKLQSFYAKTEKKRKKKSPTSGQAEQPRVSGQSGQLRYSGQSGQPRISSEQSKQEKNPDPFNNSVQGVEVQRSDITIDDLSEPEHIYKDRVLNTGVDSIAQTDTFLDFQTMSLSQDKKES